MKAKKKRNNNSKYSRRGIILVIALAVILLIVSVVTASFSWFTPVSKDGAGMEYKETTYNRSERCAFRTYEGTKVESYGNGKYINQFEYNTIITSAVIPKNGGIKYFRTSIINPDEDYASDVSLYLATLGKDANNGAGTPASDLMVAVTFPSNTVKNVNGKADDFAIIRNAFVKVHDLNDADGPGLLQVDWFVQNNGTEDITIDLSTSDPTDPDDNPNMYLMYN